MPVLLGAHEVAGRQFSIFSGQNLPADPSRGLTGECDFILAKTPPVPMLAAPLVTIVEAKQGDLELGLGQCVAQLVGAQVFNEREGTPRAQLFGCVTSGEDWQFLRLEGNRLDLDRTRYYIRDLGMLLAIFQAITA